MNEDQVSTTSKNFLRKLRRELLAIALATTKCMPKTFPDTPEFASTMKSLKRKKVSGPNGVLTLESGPGGGCTLIVLKVFGMYYYIINENA